MVDIKFGLILLTSQSEVELLCKMRKVGRMQRTTDMNILLNMSLKLNGFWLDMKIREKKIKQLM